MNKERNKEKTKLPYWIKHSATAQAKGVATSENSDKFKGIEQLKLSEEEIKKFLPSSLVSITREKISSCCVGIADRTLSLQYHQFKAQIEDNGLNLENIKTYNLSDAEVEKYLEAVKKINEKQFSNITFHNINIDIGGFSIDVAKELGNDYLRGNYILISTKQKDCDSLRKYISFEKSLIKRLFDQYKNIEQILLGEALIGRICTYKENKIDKSSIMTIIANNPESIFNIELFFDTPLGAITKLKKIRKDEKELLNDIEKLKDRRFLRNILCDIEKVTIKHGSLDRIPDKEIIIKTNVDYYKLNLQSIDIYCLKTKNGMPIFVYFDYDDIGRTTKAVMKENYKKEDYIILNGQRNESIDVLIDLGIVSYSPYLALERAVNMIINKRKEKLKKFLDYNPESSEEVRQLFLEELMKKEEIPDKAKELLLDIQSLVDHKKDKKFFYNLGKNKICMVYPLIQNEILYEMLDKLNLEVNK